MSEPTVNSAESTTYVGQAVRRVEANDKVSGALRYVDDLPFDGLWGVTVRTSAPRGVLRAISLDPGFDWSEFTIVTWKDVPGTNRVALIEQDQPFLVEEGGEFRHRHEPVALVAHASAERAREGARHVTLAWDPLPAVLDFEAGDPSTNTLAPALIQRGTDNTFKRYHMLKGEGSEALDAAVAQGAVLVEGTYRTAAQEQAYIEPNGFIGRVDRDVTGGGGTRVIVEGSHQCPYYVHKAMVLLFGLPAEQVRVIQTPTGGGFGGKEDFPSVIAGHAALLAWKAGRPVKIIYDRAEDMVCTTKRHPSRVRFRTAVWPDGRLAAVVIDVLFDGGAYNTVTPVVLSRGAIHSGGPYRCDHFEITARAVLTNTPPHGAFRGFGAPQTLFALECHMDRVAERLGLDPVELRRKNLLVAGDTMSTGQRFKDPVALDALMDDALAKADWPSKRAAYDAFNAEAARTGSPLRKGIGLATFMHGAGFTGSGEVFLDSRVKVQGLPDGRVEVCVANTEIGQGATTIFAQVAADALGLPIEAIAVATPDTDRVPNSGPTVASRTAMVVGHLVARACDDLVAKLVETDALRDTDRSHGRELRVSAQAVGLGRHYPPERLQAAVRAAVATQGRVEGWARYEAPPGILWDDKLYRGDAYGAYAWATYVADVEVDLDTGATRCVDFVASQEIGRVLNPTLAAGQIEGGVVQAIGWALLEDCFWRDGAMLNGTLTNYIIPTSADVPPIRVFFSEAPYDYGPFGAKGIGELPMDGPAPAILNAIAHATGLRIDHAPATPERVMAALGGAAKEVA